MNVHNWMFFYRKISLKRWQFSKPNHVLYIYLFSMIERIIWNIRYCRDKKINLFKLNVGIIRIRFNIFVQTKYFDLVAHLLCTTSRWIKGYCRDLLQISNINNICKMILRVTVICLWIFRGIYLKKKENSNA